jgi:hypothetical protein
VTKTWFLYRESADWQRANGTSIRKWQRDLEYWMDGERRRNPDAFKASKAPPESGQAWKTIDPTAFAKWAATFTKPPQLEGATDRLVERFLRESRAKGQGPGAEGSSSRAHTEQQSVVDDEPQRKAA